MYGKFEADMEFLGMSIVEDVLQQDVPETISKLKSAGIKTWILTGDKLETALYVAKNCRLSGKDNSEGTILKSPDGATFLQDLTDIENGNPNGCELLSIDGPTLAIALEDKDHENRFFELAKKCDAIIFARLAPNQKA